MPRKPKSATQDVTANDSVLSRFSGSAGKTRLLDIASGTYLLHGIPGIEELVQGAALEEFNEGATLMEQGGTDDAIHLILSGSFDLEVNGRHWTKRFAGTHIGEAAMLDSTAKRNATARAAEHSMVLSFTEASFSDFANKNPDLWRRIAVELSRRLTERTKQLQVPRSEPVMFLGCSSEALAIAQEIQAGLSRDVLVRIWTDGVFYPSKSAIEDLCEMSANVDFAAILLTPDDKTISRKKMRMTPRDNVLFELGMMMGSLGRERSFFIVEAGNELKIPSDLLGVTPLSYQRINKPVDAQARLGPVCTAIRRSIKQLGPI